jgi:hypothetical protein
MGTHEPLIIYEIQAGLLESVSVLKTPDGWLIGQAGLVKKDRYTGWSCNCAIFGNLGVCSHTVAAAVSEDPQVRTICEDFERCFRALGVEARRTKAALKSSIRISVSEGAPQDARRLFFGP